MTRRHAAGFVGAIVLTTVLLGPGAQAAGTHGRSTSCAFVAMLKFKPALEQGSNPRAFIKLSLKLDGCTGGTVSSAHGYGGSIGDLTCDSGQISGQAAAKAELFWNTGDTSGLNLFFDFDRSSLRGQVVDSLFKGERVRAKDFSLTPVKGDCAGSPLIRARMTGTLGL